VERTGTRRWRKSQFELTDRQRHVLRLIERGYSNSEIATALGITLDGAKFHVSEILAKLEVSSREDAVAAWKRDAPSRPWLAWIALGMGAAALSSGALIVFAVVRGGDDGGSNPPAAPGTVAAAPVAFACPPPRTPTPTLLPNVSPTPEPLGDGPFRVRFNGRWYTQNNNVSSSVIAADSVPPGLLGSRYGEICYSDVRGNRPAPGDQPRDGDSWGLSVGMEVFTVVGYSPEFRLALRVPGQPPLMLEVVEYDKARSGADILDLGGKVARLDIFGEVGSAAPPIPIATLSDQGELDQLVERLLQAPIATNVPIPDGGTFYTLQFTLHDGTHVSRQYSPIGYVGNLDVSPPFEAEIRLLVSGRP